MTVKAITNIFRSRTRSLLTMAGIAVGVPRWELWEHRR